MGIDLAPIANHNIKFNNRPTNNVGDEICEKLNALQLQSHPFLKQYTFWLAHYYNWSASMQQNMLKEVWSFSIHEINSSNLCKQVSFSLNGPFNLEIELQQNSLTFSDPVCRYSQWLSCNYTSIRNEWRKVHKSIIDKLGGNRVIYLADSHYVVNDATYYHGTFNEIEDALISQLGKPKKSFSNVLKEYPRAYFIDSFADLDLNEKVDYHKIKPLDVS